MVQKPQPRRSKPTRNPVTIDLEATEVKEEAAAAKPAHDAEPVAFDAEPAPDAATPHIAEKIEDMAAVPDESAEGSDEAARGAVESGSSKQEEPEAPRQTRAAPTPPPSRSGGFSALGGGIIGGVVALLLAGGLQWAGLIPSLRSAPAVDLTPVQTRIDELSGKLAAMEGAATASPADFGPEIEAVRAAADANTKSVADMQAKLDELSRAVSSGSAGDGAGAAALSGRVDTLETRLADLTAKLGALESAPSGVDPAAMDALKSDTSSAIDGLKSELASLSDRLAAAEKELASGGGNRVAAALAASALKAAADRGTGFMAELEAYATVSGDEAGIAALHDYAASGVPTVAQLTERFPAVANAIVATASGAAPDAGIGERLMASARSLVQIRPVGEVEGDTPGAIAARMEVALKAGDLDRMTAEWEKLPDEAKQASAAYMADVKARRELDRLISNVLTGAMQSAAPAAQ